MPSFVFPALASFLGVRVCIYTLQSFIERVSGVRWGIGVARPVMEGVAPLYLFRR